MSDTRKKESLVELKVGSELVVAKEAYLGTTSTFFAVTSVARRPCAFELPHVDSCVFVLACHFRVSLIFFLRARC